VTITIDGPGSFDGELLLASSELLALSADTVEDDGESQVYVLTDLSIDEVIIDYQEGDVIDLTRLGFELATGEFNEAAAEEFVRYLSPDDNDPAGFDPDGSPGALFVDVDGAGGPAEFELAAQLSTTPLSVIVRLTDGSTTDDVVIA